MKYLGMNYSEYVDHLMDRYGMSESDAELQADSDFGLLEDEDLHEPIIDLLELWTEAEDRISERRAIEGVIA